MSFLYPLGLWGLLGIPVLILIYIIKNTYIEQTVASTYLWTLSERFLKRRRRLVALSGLISLLLQILAVALISLLIARPTITVPDSANEYCFILDGSGSMNTLSGQVDKETGEPVTRFEAGKDAIAARIDEAVDGSLYTIVYVGDSTGVICERVEDKEKALLLLGELEPVHRAVTPDEALRTAQGYFDENRGLLTTLVTDKDYETAENVEVLNVAGAVENYAVSEIVHFIRDKQLTVQGKLTSYTSDATLHVDLFINDETEPAATAEVEAKAGVPAAFELTAATDAYASLTVKVRESDALGLDNTHIIHNIKSENSYNTLLVSERPFFIESAIRSLLNAEIDVIEPKDYNGQSGYGLYIFDTIDPSGLSGLPSDGSVWLLNVAGSIEGAGYTVQGEVKLEEAGLLTHATSTATATQKLVAGMKKNDIYITRYIKCAPYRQFTTLLSYQGYPAVFAGTTADGNREAVVAFDIHDSNLPLLFDYSVLIRNLVQYSFPDMVDTTAYTCGESAVINVIPNCESIRVTTPSGKVQYLSTEGASDSMLLSEIGEYTVNMTVAGSVREFYLFASMEAEERTPVQTEPTVALQGEASPGGFDGRFDPTMILFIALALVFCADWMVYCYEKYQLR